MRPKDQKRGKILEAKLVNFDKNARSLPGIKNKAQRTVFVEQLVESLRRVEYAHLIRDTNISADRADPSKGIFDPLRAAVWWARKGNIDEALWLVFLFVYFGKHRKDGWRLVRDVYGALGAIPWTWDRVSKNPNAFRQWLAANEATLRTDGVSRRFGNHRRYGSLSATAAAVESYLAWIGPTGSHWALIQKAHTQVGQNPFAAFDYLYQSMSAVKTFGRLAKFDYLTMLGKLGLAPIEPPLAYLNGATGPLGGARLLFGGSKVAKIGAKTLDSYLEELDTQLQVGKQVLEDALCNWQKSPETFKPFRG